MPGRFTGPVTRQLSPRPAPIPTFSTMWSSNSWSTTTLSSLVHPQPNRLLSVISSAAFAQELLADDLAAAAVVIEPAPINGLKALPLAQLLSAFPLFANTAVKHRTVPRRAPAAIRRRRRELFPPVAGQSRHPQSRPWAAVADLRNRGPHRASQRHQRSRRDVLTRTGAERLSHLRGTRTFTHHRQRMERRRATWPSNGWPLNGF